jgi:hypothetical protein
VIYLELSNEIGRACSTYGKGEICIQVLVKNMRERDHWRDEGVDGRIILRRIFRQWDVEIWAGLSWLRNSWRKLVNAVMNLRVP